MATTVHAINMSQARSSNATGELNSGLSAVLHAVNGGNRAKRVPFTRGELLRPPQLMRALRALLTDYQRLVKEDVALTVKLGLTIEKYGAVSEKNQEYQTLNMELKQRDNVSMQRQIEGSELPEAIEAARTSLDRITAAAWP